MSSKEATPGCLSKTAKKRLQLMVTMLKEVRDGVWNPGPMTVERLGWLPTAMAPTTIPEPGSEPVVEDVVLTFDLEQWVAPHSDGASCGYSACAVGHACMDPRFRELGLNWGGNGPYYDGITSWGAVCHLFDIGRPTARFLFSDVSYLYGDDANEYWSLGAWHKSGATPQMVINRIELMLQADLAN